MDGSSVVRMYHSHTEEIADTNAGLVGPMVITAQGMADTATATPLDVDREVFSYFTVENENQSQHLDRNLAELARGPHQVAPADEEAFEESNLMHPSTATCMSTDRFPCCTWGSACGGTRSPSAPRWICTHPTGTETP
jgi:hypothetical protein